MNYWTNKEETAKAHSMKPHLLLMGVKELDLIIPLHQLLRDLNFCYLGLDLRTHTLMGMRSAIALGQNPWCWVWLGFYHFFIKIISWISLGFFPWLSGGIFVGQIKIWHTAFERLNILLTETSFFLWFIFRQSIKTKVVFSQGLERQKEKKSLHDILWQQGLILCVESEYCGTLTKSFVLESHWGVITLYYWSMLSTGLLPVKQEWYLVVFCFSKRRQKCLPRGLPTLQVHPAGLARAPGQGY